MARVCLFCDRTRLTKEHVFAAWLRDALPIPRQVNVRDADDQPLWSQGTFDIVARVVCEQCNSGWMSDLEAACGPLLRHPIRYGSAMTLTLDEQRSVAMWAVKTAMVLEAHRRRTDAFAYLPKPHAKSMPDHTTPPTGTAVRLFGRLAGEGEFIITRSVGILSRHPKGQPRKGVNEPRGYVSTVVVGYLGFHVLGSDYEDEAAPRLIDTPSTQEYLIRLWPPTGGVIRWPPRRAMLLSDILRLAVLGQPVQ